MANSEFKSRLKAAVLQIVNDMTLDDLASQRLYTPIFRDGKYTWVSPMDSDGLLVRERTVGWERNQSEAEVRLRIGVIIQAEATTSLTKPNPFGKALVGSLPLGAWVDLKLDNGGIHRVRLDRSYVLFVVPKGAAAPHKRTYEIARTNVSNAAAATDGAHMIEVSRGDAAAELARKLQRVVQKWLVGRGRPSIG